MTMLTDQQLAEIRAREQAATPGPWVVTCHKHDPHADHGIAEQGSLYWRGVASVGKDRNVAFIAHSRTDIPALLAHIEEQHREMEHYKRAMQYVVETCIATMQEYTGETPPINLLQDAIFLALNATKESTHDRN